MTKNQVSAEVRDVYRSMLQRAHDSTHYEDCWKDHYPCVLEKVLDEVDRLANALSQSVETVKSLSAEHSVHEPGAPPADQWTPAEISRFEQSADSIVQCRCGWMGKVSALKSLPEFKRGCPECSAEFKPLSPFDMSVKPK